eukprot:1388647-Amphidinium_carterae.1
MNIRAECSMWLSRAICVESGVSLTQTYPAVVVEIPWFPLTKLAALHPAPLLTHIHSWPAVGWPAQEPAQKLYFGSCSHH